MGLSRFILLKGVYKGVFGGLKRGNSLHSSSELIFFVIQTIHIIT